MSALKSASPAGAGRSAVVRIAVIRPFGANVMTPRGFAPNRSNSSPESSILILSGTGFLVPRRPSPLALEASRLAPPVIDGIVDQSGRLDQPHLSNQSMPHLS